MTASNDAGRQRIETMLSSLVGGREIPRNEGDLTFEKSWEIRAFAMAVALHDLKLFEWKDFQSRLIDSIQSWERTTPDADWGYYEHWLEALEKVLESSRVVDDKVVEERTRMVLMTPRDAEHQRANRDPVAVSTPVLGVAGTG